MQGLNLKPRSDVPGGKLGFRNKLRNVSDLFIKQVRTLKENTKTCFTRSKSEDLKKNDLGEGEVGFLRQQARELEKEKIRIGIVGLKHMFYAAVGVTVTSGLIALAGTISEHHFHQYSNVFGPCLAICALYGLGSSSLAILKSISYTLKIRKIEKQIEKATSQNPVIETGVLGETGVTHANSQTNDRKH
ncbi:MAG: hypothetical protein AB1391_04250 [Candidatus Micrarchaeota archaeon]